MATDAMATDAKTTDAKVRRPAAVSTGNPRVTVAFPFSKIEINEPPQELRDLAVLVQEIARQAAALASQVTPDQAAAADQLAVRAALLAESLNPSS